MTRPVVEVLDGSWKFTSVDELKRLNVYPNSIAYQPETKHAALILKRSSGGDFAMGVTGVNLLADALEKKQLQDGRPVTEASVVLVGGDPRSSRLGTWMVLNSYSLDEIIRRFGQETPRAGRVSGADYYWLAYDNPNITM